MFFDVAKSIRPQLRVVADADLTNSRNKANSSEGRPAFSAEARECAKFRLKSGDTAASDLLTATSATATAFVEV